MWPSPPPPVSALSRQGQDSYCYERCLGKKIATFTPLHTIVSPPNGQKQTPLSINDAKIIFRGRGIQYLRYDNVEAAWKEQQTWRAGRCLGWSPGLHTAAQTVNSFSHVRTARPAAIRRPPTFTKEKLLLSLQLLKQTFQQTRQRSNLIKCCKSESERYSWLMSFTSLSSITENYRENIAKPIWRVI